MKENKKVSPSLGVCGRLNAATKSILLFSSGRKNLNPFGLRAMLVMLLVVLGIGEMWGTNYYYTALRTMVDPEDTGKGLVYANTSPTASVTDNSYTNESKSDDLQIGKQSTLGDFYGWAKPARGYVFNNWVSNDIVPSNPEGDRENGSTPKAHTGTADLIQSRSWGGGNGTAGNSVTGTAKATWLTAPSFMVTYKQPVGGTYSVQYSYYAVNTSTNKFIKPNPTESATLTPISGDWAPLGVSADQNGLSYEADVVTLTSTETSFDGWYENDVKISDGTGSNHSYTYPITKNAAVTAKFKYANITAPEDQTINTSNNTANVVRNVLFTVEEIGGDWDASNFNATISTESGSGSMTVGSLTYSGGTLTVPVTYNANGFFDQGTTATLTVGPANAAWGESVSIIIKGLAEEVFDYDARVIDGSTTTTGSLAEMLAYANTLSSAPTLQIMRNVSVSAMLQVKKSMTLDLNNKVLSSTTLNTLILVQGDNASDKVELAITDKSFLKAGQLQISNAANGIIAGIKIADSNKVTYSEVKLNVNNTATYASNTNAKAYGVWIEGNRGNLVMNSGSILSESDQNAYGVYVGNGNATVLAATIEAHATAKAYAFHSSATANLTGTHLVAVTAAGAEAYALTVASGTATTDGVTMEATSATGNAYGINVMGGVAIVNGGSVIASGTANDIFGVRVQTGSTATIQQRVSITAASTGGANVYGVQNAGTLTLNNDNVTVTAATNYAYGVQTLSGAVRTTIEDGTFAAASTTGYACGLKHQAGALNVDGATFTASSTGDYAYAGVLSENATIANVALTAETTESAKYAYGVMADTEGKTISLSGCTIEAKSATTNAYAIRSKANLTATNCSLLAKTSGGANAYGVYAEKGANTVNNTNATVESYTTGAYGILYDNGSLNVDGGTYNVTARQATAGALADSEAYGVKVADAKTANLQNATFTVVANNSSYSRNVYGVYTGSGIINSIACIYSVSASQKAYGIYGAASSSLTLRNNTITATTTASTTAYGIYANSIFSVKGDRITSNCKSFDSYPLFFAASAAGIVESGWFKALGLSGDTAQIVAPINTASNNANVKVQGGFFNDNVRLRYYVPMGYDIYGVDPDVTEYSEGYYYTVNDHVPYENVCYITEVSRGFPTLGEAFDYARDHTGKNYNIIMIQPYTLPAGNYSLPSNATLVVPDRISRTVAIGTTAERQYPEDDQITENRCLTFAAGANLDVHGIIEVSAKQKISNVTSLAYVLGPYGRIHLEEGSTITLNSGAKINAWGYITGQGEIRVKNGAEVREFFQVYDMPAASSITDWTSTANKNTYKAFLMTQYYVQNIEAPTKYYYGGKLIGSLGILANASGSLGHAYADNVQLVGSSGAFFSVDTDDEASWVRKEYDPVSDRITWATNSSASLGAIDVSMASYPFNSKNYVLPFTNNMTIRALSGMLNITQSAVLLPGCEVIVDKTATVHVNAVGMDNLPMGLYLYDKSQWSTDAKPVLYSPSWHNGECPRNLKATNMKDAAIFVKGKMEIEGGLYTTAGGAAIYSDDMNAGTIEFQSDAAADGALYRKYDGSVSVPVTAAKLRNGGETGPDANMTITKDVAKEGDTYAYTNIDGTGFKWTKLKAVDEAGCLIADETDPENPVYYAKPQDYVAITSATADADHLFYSVEGEGELKRKFINMPMESGCQWWEVTATATTGVYYCATNGTYYHWVPDMVQVEPGVWEDQGNWEEYKVNVTFYFTDPKSEDANKKKVLEVNYGAKPDASIVSNPTKGADATATYQFYGWKSSKTELPYAYTDELESVTEDMYYLPIFTPTPKKYTITFADANNGANVYKEVAYGSNPSCDPVKDPTARYTYYFLNWTDASSNSYAIDATLPEVIGAATYTAHWAQVVNKYTITWKNGDEVLEMDTKQEYGTATAFNGSLPTKATDDNFVYAFSGWRSSLTGQTHANGSTPTVAGETTYEAQFSTTPRYKVTFANYDGTELYHEFVTQGEQHPIYKGLTPARVRDYDGYYKFTGWKNLSGTFYAKDAELPVVSAKETYTAQYGYVTELYLITLNNIDGNGASWEGKFGVGSTPFYAPDPEKPDEPAEPTKADGMEEDLLYEYTFSGWDPELEEVSATSTKEYTAQFAKEVKKYFITFANLDGNGAKDSVEVAYGSTPASPVTPTKADACNTYAFDHWEPAIQSVTGRTTYTAVFSETPDTRTFAITFDGDNDLAPVVMNVECGAKPVPATPTREDASFYYTFTGWSDGEHVYATADLPVASAEVTYTAQYSQTLRSYTIAFVNYDGTPLQSSDFAYGAMPTYTGAEPIKPVDMVNKKKYTFNGTWSPAITTVAGEVTYTAQFEEKTFKAIITPESGDPYYATDWDDIMSHLSNGCTLKLYSNIDNISYNQAISVNMTINLNGYTMSGSTSQTNNSRVYMLNVSRNLTIVDSGTNGKIMWTGSGGTAYSAIYVTGNSASLTIESGIVEGNNSANSGNSRAARAVLLDSNAKLYVNGGELIATCTGRTTHVVYNNNGTIVNITAGKLKSSGANGRTNMFNSATGVTLHGGYYNMDVSSFCAAPYYNFTTTSAERSVVGNDYTNKVAEAYTITFNNWDNSNLSTLQKQIVGSTPAYSSATPTKTPQSLYSFIGWKNTAEDFFAADATLPAVTANETYTAQFEEVETFDVDGNASVTEDAEVETTTVHVDGKLDVADGVTLTTTNLILNASETASGQIYENGTITATNVYYDLTLNTYARHWHSFGVPWMVDLNTNPLTEVETGRTLTIGRDYDIMYYNGEKRAQEGINADCWEYVQDNGNTLTPGQGYMIAFTSAVKTLRFVKAAGAPVIFSSAMSVAANYSGTETDKGINAIANPMAYHAKLDVGVGVGQIHVSDTIGSDEYTEVNIENRKFIVGKAVYVKVPAAQPVVIAPAGSAGDFTPVAAPARRAKKQDEKKYMTLEDYYTVSLTPSNGSRAAKVYVLPMEEKDDAFITGQDLAKMSMSTKKAQIWVNRYESKLALNTTAPVNDIAQFPISVYAPEAGEYTISLQSQPDEEYTVYLTQDGRAFWNLSMDGCSLELAKGTNKSYGLRLVANKAPQTATGIDEALVDAQGETRKVIIEDKVYIIRGDQVYSIDGQLVK